MREEELKQILNNLLALPVENECVEFKEAKESFSNKELGKYFSALSNEANLKGELYGWLVLGVNDNHNIVGTNFKINRADLDSLKRIIADRTNNRITFIEIYELSFPEGRVLMFQIPPAPKGIPTSFGGYFFGREGESIGALNIQEIEQIRNQVKTIDWSAQICEEASINDLDTEAIEKARINYKEKFPSKSEEIDDWSDATFLNKSKVTIQGKITRTAIILLGKQESEHFLSPAVVKISWILKDENKNEKDYEHFSCPLILNSEAVFNKIRNLNYRYLQDNTLFPTELTKYEPYVIREAIHNCIAHQDYELSGRINVIEFPDELVFSNMGSFIPITIEKVLTQNAPQETYRNWFLANAMFNLNMIDTIGSGIKKIFEYQRKRFFPLPDYDLNTPDKVEVKITGKVIDENYTRLLIHKTDLDLQTIILLDKIQKRYPITKDLAESLKLQKLIEGRKPNYFISSGIANVTGEKGKYIKNRAFDDEHYKDMIISFIDKYGSASRKDIDDLLWDKLSNILNDKQKKNKIRNIIYSMSKRERKIINKGTGRFPKWCLSNF